METHINEQTTPIITDSSRAPAPGPGVIARITLDTNVWLDWLVFADPIIEPVRAAVSTGEVRLVGHSMMRDELQQVLQRLVWREQPIADQAVAMLERYDQLVSTDDRPLSLARWRCRDPDDQMYVDWLAAGHTDGVLTKDKALLRMAQALRLGGVGWINHPANALRG